MDETAKAGAAFVQSLADGAAAGQAAIDAANDLQKTLRDVQSTATAAASVAASIAALGPRERCSFEDGALEIRSAPDGAAENAPTQLVGYAVRWGQLSSDLGGYRETFAKGAFADVLAFPQYDVAALIDHDPSKIIGRRSAGTLRLAEDDQGLRYEVDLPKTTAAADLAESIRRGDKRGSSFAFKVAPDGQQKARIDGEMVRMVSRVSALRDVGPVTFPAYESSSATLRWLQEDEPEPASEPQTPPVDTGAHVDVRRRLLDLAQF